MPSSATDATPHDAPPAALDGARGAAPYKNQCAAMGVKPNSRILPLEQGLTERPKLDFTLNYIGGTGLQAITDAISRNEHLESLVLTSNGLTNESVVFLCRALKTHALLKTLDLSSNPISLPAGLALIDLVKSNTVIREVNLTGTLVDDAVQAKLRRLININRTRKEKAEAAAAAKAAAIAEAGGTLNESAKAPPAVTPYQRAVQDYEQKAAKRRREREAQVKSLEDTAAVGISEQLRLLGTKGPQRGPDGWVVLHLYISTAPHGFTSELRLLHNVIIPRLNAKFAARKVTVVPFSMYYGVPPLSKEKAKAAPKRHAILTDHHEGVLRSAPLFLQIVGDKVGLSEFHQAHQAATEAATTDRGAKGAAKKGGDSAAAASNDNADGENKEGFPHAHWSKQHSLPHLVADGARILERELALASDNGLRLVFRRCPALSMGVPSAILATVTDDPHVVYPDPQTHVVKTSVAKAQGIDQPRFGDFDFEAEKYRWSKHVDYRKSLENRIPRPFLVDYAAKFDTVDPLGQVVLSQLEEFETALVRRLEAAIDLLYPAAADDARPALTSKIVASAEMTAALEKAVLQQSIACAIGRKGIAGKLDLYTVTPPSRNMQLVTCTPGSGATSVAAGYAVRSAQKQSYILASHFATSPWLSDQPSDLRAMLLNLMRQLLRDDVPTHIATEVDVNRVKQYFGQTLGAVVGDAGDHKTVVILLDGIDDLDAAILPCRNLRIGDTGVDEWDPPAEQKTIQKPLPAVTHRQVDTFDWIPICLSRNLRFVVTAQRDSEAHKTLELRGHDSCDSVPVGDISDNDVETILMRECEAIGVLLRDEEVAVVRGKTDSRVPEYLTFVLNYIRSREESQQYTTRLTGLSQLPQTAAEMCERLLDRMENDFGKTLTRTLISLLLASRWGLQEWELRALLRQQATQVKEAGASADEAAAKQGYNAPLLNGELYQRVLRCLRPVLANTSEVLAWTKRPFNGVHVLVHLRSRTFRAAATRRYMSDDAVFLSAHHQLCHHYRRLVGVAGPLESKAVREFPYHVVKGEMWALLESHVASLDFVAQAYLHRLGYEALRELVRAYNTLDDIATERAESATSVRAPPPVAGKPEGPLTRAPTSSAAHLSDETIAALKLKLREYCYFVKQHNVNLVQYPHMVRQIAITCPPESCLHEDAKDYFRQLEKFPHFVVMNRTRAKLHTQAIADCVFAPTGLRVATCSDDRTVKICGLTSDALVTVNQSVSKVTTLTYSGTSRYIAAVCLDRSIMVIDATNGSLISRPVGHMTTVKSVALSARGRFLFTGGEDRLVKCWDSESGAELFTASMVSQSHHTSPHGSVNMILPHPHKEDVFYTVTDKKLIGWKVKSSALDAAEEILCVVGHNTLPLAAAHIACDGAFAITTAKDLVTPASHFTRAEDNIKVWSLDTGRCLATLSQGTKGTQPGHITSVLSPDEKVLAAATLDGGLDLYRLEWRSYAPAEEANGAPVIVTPHRALSAYREHPTPKLGFLAFSFDSSYVAAIGNLRQLKVWSTEVDRIDAADGAADGAAGNADDKQAVGGSLLTALSAADRTVAEFLMEQPATCMAWTPSPVEEGGELMVGDEVGRLHALKLKR